MMETFQGINVIHHGYNSSAILAPLLACGIQFDTFDPKVALATVSHLQAPRSTKYVSTLNRHIGRHVVRG